VSRRNINVSSCIKDERRPLEIGVQALVSNHLKVLLSKAMVLNVKEKAVFKLSDMSYGNERKRTIDDASKCSNVIKTKVGMAILG
jgi:hypothetical protein